MSIAGKSSLVSNPILSFPACSMLHSCCPPVVLVRLPIHAIRQLGPHT